MPPPIPVSRDPRVGSTLNQTYLIERQLGLGGMGVVYAAQHVHLHRQVAVKVLHPQIAEMQTPLERFRREAQIASQLGHPGLVSVIDFNFTEDGAPYMVMELLHGETLADRLTRGPLDLSETCALFHQLCDALHTVHEAGVVHRDLKPDNIFLITPDDGPQRDPAALRGDAPASHNRDTVGEYDDRQRGPAKGTLHVKILDFGVSKIHDAEAVQRAGHDDSELTGHEVLGTPSYLAPEQATGGAHVADRRADVFALGTILYECLTGQKAFDGPHAVAILRIMMTQRIPRACDRLPGLPPAVDEVIAQACAMEPLARFATTWEMCAALFAAVGLAPPRPLPRASLGLDALPPLAPLATQTFVSADDGPELVRLADAPPVPTATEVSVLPPSVRSPVPSRRTPQRGVPGPMAQTLPPLTLAGQATVITIGPVSHPTGPAQSPQPAVGPHLAELQWGDGDTLFDADIEDLRARPPGPGSDSSRQKPGPLPSLPVPSADVPLPPSRVSPRRPVSQRLDEFTVAEESESRRLSPPRPAPWSPAQGPAPGYGPSGAPSLDRATAILDTIATPPAGVARPPQWTPTPAPSASVPGSGPRYIGAEQRSWVVTLTTALVAVLVGIVVGMLVLKLMARNDNPSLALERTQQIEQLLSEAEQLGAQSRCGDAIQRASAVLLVDPGNVRARRLISRCKR